MAYMYKEVILKLQFRMLAFLGTTSSHYYYIIILYIMTAFLNQTKACIFYLTKKLTFSVVQTLDLILFTMPR